MKNRVAMLLACTGLALMVFSEVGLSYQIKALCLLCNAIGIVVTMFAVSFLYERKREDNGQYILFYLISLSNLVLSPYFVLTLSTSLASHRLVIFSDWYWQIIPLGCLVLTGVSFNKESRRTVEV